MLNKNYLEKQKKPYQKEVNQTSLSYLDLKVQKNKSGRVMKKSTKSPADGWG